MAGSVDAQLKACVAAGELADIDLHFARAVATWGGEDEAVRLAAALLGHLAGSGHVCVGLADFAEAAMPFANRLIAPSLTPWLAALRAHGACGEPGAYRPLILDGERLYLHRHWRDETGVAADLIARSAGRVEVDDADLQARLDRLFEGAPAEAAGQRDAVARAARKGVTLISGGPGTGKTTTLAALLAMVVEQGANANSILLAAPTGKAAARMEQAVRDAKGRLPLTPETAAKIPDQARTLHRLLGIRPDGSARHDGEHPLDCDLLVIDEASMVDMALMARVLAALPARALLVLLGDRDQLASVEAGAVFADLCLSAEQGGVLADSYAPLSHSFRFGGGGGIGLLARALREGDGDAAIAILGAKHPELEWHGAPSRGGLLAAVRLGYADYLKAVAGGEAPDQLHHRFARFRLLLAHREGPWGVRSLNGAIENAIGVSRHQPWYPGRPVMVSANDYNLRLFNGDIGITAVDPAGGELKVWFEDEAGLRAVSPHRLPACETAWAMTVHKSQGSEFDRVLLALPDQPSPLVTRELVYTGITRARSGVDLWAGEGILRDACSRRIRRYSGLAARLG